MTPLCPDTEGRNYNNRDQFWVLTTYANTALNASCELELIPATTYKDNHDAILLGGKTDSENLNNVKSEKVGIPTQVGQPSNGAL